MPPSIAADSWRTLPERADAYGELAAQSVDGATAGVFIAVDHEGARHLLLPVPVDGDIVSDDRSRGIRASTRTLAVQEQPERPHIDVVCTTMVGHDVFNLVATAIVQLIADGAATDDAVRTTLARWRRFWGAVPSDALSGEQIRGLFGELRFLAEWLLPNGSSHVRHWLGPTGARHDFQWAALAIECKATTSTRGHIHRINGLDQLDPPANGALCVYSLRVREETTATDSLTTLIETITSLLENDGDALEAFETRLAQAGYSPLEAERYAETRYRVISERLYDVGPGFPRLSTASFLNGVPDGIEHVEYEINLNGCASLVAANAPRDFAPPSR